MKIEIREINTRDLRTNDGSVEGLPRNPRKISKKKLEQLKKSVKDAPEMLKLRELIVVESGGAFVVIAGNQRLEAAKALGLATLPCKVLPNDTPAEKLREYAIKDNLPFGEDDWEILTGEWDVAELEEWGMEVKREVEKYTSKIDIPIYEPSGMDPNLETVIDLSKYEELLRDIENSGVKEKEKEFLRLAAARHIVFDYELIGDYYASAGEEMQSLMEKSALVIIDFGKAIENGFVRMSERLLDINKKESNEK